MGARTSRLRGRRIVASATLASGFLLATAPAALAQETVSEVVGFLVTSQAVPTGDPARDELAALATADTIANALRAALATPPVSSSSSGFTYRFNEELGTVERTSDSFGALFTERALTSGRGQGSVGVSVRYARYSSLDDAELRDGFVTVANQFEDEPTAFDRDTLSLRIDTVTTTVVASYGITDRLDLGVAVPFVRLSLEGDRINEYRGNRQLQAAATATATGVADMVVRAKYAFASGRPGGVGIAADLRLPTGREEDLLGAGSTALRIVGIVSMERGRGAFHANAGGVFGGLSEELTVTGAASLAATPRVTIAGEVVVRRLADVGRIHTSVLPHPTVDGVQTLRWVATPGEASTPTFGVGSVKWNVTRTWIITASALVPLTDTGLRAPVVPSIGMEYAFGN